jgi:pimeloyl-ACP methyl ester carboxylesterase
MLYFSFFLLSFVGVVLFLLINSRGTPEQFITEDGKPLEGSLSEKIFININGLRQGMFIKSRNTDNQVLLYLHGGLPDYFLHKKYASGIENYYTVVWWEQRGSGLSYRGKESTQNISGEQVINDILEVTKYLRERFGKEKIYLMGISGGTFFGIQAAARFPQFYFAYIGVSQISFQLQSEINACAYLTEQYRSIGKKKMVKALESEPLTAENGTSVAWLSIRDKGMHRFGVGTMHDMNSVVTGLFIPSLICRDYTLKEKYNLWLAKSQSGVSVLWKDILSTDLSAEFTEFKLPVYFFEGIFDYTCSYTLAKSYFKKIKAPVKGFYSFSKSAHSPLFEEPERVQQLLQADVLKGTNALADLI